MKTFSQPSIVSPTVIALLLAFAAVAYIGVTGKKVPVLSNVRLDILLLTVIGMAVCSQAGIGRIASTGQWLHPQSILGYFLGGLILLVALFAFFEWKLPVIQNEQQALLVIAVLTGVKVINSVIHYWLSLGWM